MGKQRSVLRLEYAHRWLQSGRSLGDEEAICTSLGGRKVIENHSQFRYVAVTGGGFDAGPAPQPAGRDSRAYLFTMAANLALDHLRVEKRRGDILAEADGLVWRASEDLTPERHVMAKAELAHVEAAIRALPERSRRVFHMSRFEGLSQPEIAGRLGIGITVYKDLKRALDTLVKARRRFREGVSENPGAAGTGPDDSTRPS